MEDKMQKWEYLTLYTNRDGNELKFSLANGQEIRDWKKGPTLFEFLNTLGEQGWELISTSPYTLKRAKP
jgi:hypothetical protein